MLFYIWVRFEWQFSLGSIIAIFHDVLIDFTKQKTEVELKS